VKVFLRSFGWLFGAVILVAGISAQNLWKSGRIEANGDLVAVYFTSPTRGWVAGDNGYLAFTEDGGQTWRRYPLDTTENINEIYFRNEKNGYLVAGRKMFITNDSGRTWQETLIYRPGDFRSGTPEFLSIRFADKKYGYVIGSILNRNGDVIDSLLMRTDDEGTTWRRQIAPTKAELFHLDFSGNSHGWIVGDKGVILATTDRGESWRLQNSGTARALFAVDFRDDNEGYAVGGGGTILRTVDGGRHWQAIRSGQPYTLKRVSFADEKNGWIVGFNGAILRTQDAGLTWEKVASPSTARLFGLYMSKKYGFAVGEKGLVLEYNP
jgi:photosystem II stability/assembly factor-like uncharacterized protein